MGGKSGGGGGQDGSSYWDQTTVVDPVTGRTFSSSPSSMAGGGKSAAEQLNDFIREREAGEKVTSDQAATDKANADALARSTFNTNKTNAYNDALANITRTFTQQGLDPNQYLESDIRPRLNAIQNSITDLDPKPSAAYSADLGTTIINDLTSGTRTRGLNALNSIFTPTYSTTNLPSTLDDPYIEQILGEQFSPLSAQLENARKRNILNDVGYGAAQNTLEQKRTGARASLSTLGESILNDQRASLDDYISGARSAANSASVNSGFDPNIYTTQARNMIDTDVNTFGGALRNSVGETKYATLSDLLNAGGAVQGAANTKPLTAAGGIPTGSQTDDLDALTRQRRGLGSQGAF